MQILECGCDMAREVEGLAAHLLERGKPRDEVAAQLEQHFGLVLARGPSPTTPMKGAPDALDGLADAFAKESAVTGPANVPTGARKTAPGPGDPSPRHPGRISVEEARGQGRRHERIAVFGGPVSARVAAVVVLALSVLSGVAGAQNPRPWASKVPKELARKPNPAPNTPQILAEGKEIYLNTCLPCHGEMAQGDGPAAAFIVPPPKPLIVNGKLAVPDGVAFWVITNGIEGTGMASLAEALTEQERWKVIRFLHTLAAPAPAATPNVAATPVPGATPAVAATPGTTPAVAATPAPPAATPSPAGGGAAKPKPTPKPAP
jgi:mono/diheme cytochrome c family protein